MQHSIVKESTGFMPVLQIREGEIMKELKNLIDEEKEYKCSCYSCQC